VEHQFSCYQPSEPMQRFAPVAGQPPVFDRLAAAGNMAVQRSALGNRSDAPSSLVAPPIVHDTLRSSGAPLDHSTRSLMESRLGQDFSHVRVHSDDRAAASANAVEASAYTVGRDVVFGAGQYHPETERGQQLLAHELTHVVQQGGSRTPADGLQVGPADDQHEREARQSAKTFGANQQGAPSAATPAQEAQVQRFGIGDVLDVVSPGAGEAWKNASTGQLAAAGVTAGLMVASPVAATNWVAWISNPRNQQFLDDLKTSVAESPQHVKEFFVDEVWAAIKERWPQILAVTVALLVAEATIGALAAAPEPTFLTKLIAVILQIVVIALLVYFAGSEITSAYDEGRNWFSIAYQADGAPALVSDASRSFVRMVWHIVMTVLAVAGVRARISGFGIPAGAASVESGVGGGLEEGSNVTDISSHPKYVSHFDQPSGPVASGGTQTYFGPRGEALKVDPLLEPPPAVTEAAPTPATASATTPSAGPGVQPLPAVGAAVSLAQKQQKKQKPQCGDPELPWTSFRLAGSDRGEHMVANPLTKCGPSGSRPSIRLPGWSCIQAALGNETAYWVHAHLLHGLGGGNMDLHGPGDDPRNLIITDKSLNYWMWRDVEAVAISLAHIHDRTLSYEVTPAHVSNSNDRRYFSDRMNITLKEIDPLTRAALRVLYNGPVTSSNQRPVPPNCQ